MKKKMIGLVAAILVLAAAYLLPLPGEGLSREGMVAIAIPIFCVILWVAELVPPAVTSLFIIVFVPLLGLMPLNEAFANFGITTVFFCLAASSLTVLFMKSSIPHRLIHALLRLSRGDKNLFILAFLVATAFFSGFMSDMLTALLMLGIVRPLLKDIGAEPGRSGLGKALMIGIPGAAMIGGMCTPVGSVINILAIGIVEQVAGTTATFLDWMAVGIPSGVLVLAVFFLMLIRVCKPEELSKEVVALVEARTMREGGLDPYEKKVIAFTVALFFLWFAGSFVTWLNATAVAMIALFVMFLPGVSMLTWEEFSDGVPWNVILVFGAVGVFIAPFTSTGAAAWVAQCLAAATAGLGGVGIATLAAAFIVLLNGFIPLGTASAAMFSAPLALVAATSGALSPVAVAMIVGMGSAVSMLIPQNVVYFLSLDDGYYTTSDSLKVGAVPTLVLLGCLAVVPLALTGLLGL